MRTPPWAALALLVIVGCAPMPGEAPDVAAPDLEDLASPAGPGAMAPSLVTDGEDLLMSWLEPTADGGHRMLLARHHAGAWGEPVVIAAGDDFFANWADVPKVAVAGDGTLWAHWLAKVGTDTYAYGIFLARSDDGGRNWSPQGLLHDDGTETEHGFVAYAPEGEALRAVWLDGREMANDGPMTVRTALLSAVVGPSSLLDDRACECCPAELVTTAGGAVALYRDRSAAEIRNIGVVRRQGEEWTAPVTLHEDGWMIPGCPVNGPAADATGTELAVAWFTVIDEQPRVQLAFSSDAGASFSPPLLVDGDRPLGRVDLARAADGSAWVSWLAVEGQDARVQLARFDREGERERYTVATTGSSRASGIPRLARVADSLYVAWVETAEDRPAAIRLARLAHLARRAQPGRQPAG